VLSELDSLRQSFILGSIKNGQVLITGCDDNVVNASVNNSGNGLRVMRVESGKLKVES
jgi:recombinational DNA repair ATPase RecF